MENEILKIDTEKLGSISSKSTLNAANKISDALGELKTVQIGAWDLTAKIKYEGEIRGIKYRNISVRATTFDGEKTFLVSDNFLGGEFLRWWLGRRYVRQLDDGTYRLAHEENYTEEW